jgi:amicoumacin kinase
MICIPDKVICEITKCYGTDKDKVKYLGGGYEGSDGIVFEYNDRGGKRALKFMIMDENDFDKLLRTKERLKFVNFLGGKGVNIVYPQLSKNGRFLEQYKLDGKIYLAYSMNKVEGKGVNALEPSDMENFIVEWGKVVGQTHRHTKSYPTWQHSVVDETTGETMLSWEEEWKSFEDWCKDEEVKQCWRSLKKELDKLPKNRDCFGFIHNDPHPLNLIIQDGKVTLLDFDVASYHWFMTDIATAIYGALCGEAGGFERPQKNKDFSKYLLDKFMSGYERENHLDSIWLDKLELFLSYRRMLLFIVFYDGLKNDKEYFEHWKRRIIDNMPIMVY